MRTVQANVLTAIAKRELVARDFITITARNFSTGLPEVANFWSDIGPINASVIDAVTLAPVVRTYVGSGTMFAIGDIPLTSDLTIRSINAALNHVNDAVNNFARGYDLKGAPVEIHRGLFDPINRNLVAAAELRFVGFVDDVNFVTPPEGGDGQIKVKLVAHTRELSRANAEKRSDESQQRRSAGDRFFQHASVVPEWDQFWGQASGRIPTVTVGSGNPAADAARRLGLR